MRLPFFVELGFAAVQYNEVGFGIGPCFEVGGLVFPFAHFFVIKHFAGVHVFDVDLDFCIILRWHVDVGAKFLLFVQFPCKFCDVGDEIPLDIECRQRLFLFEGCYGAPFSFDVGDDCFDCLSAVADVIVL